MADTVKLHYSEVGQGTPVVLLHGFPLSSVIWQDQQRQLSDGFRIITPGKSPVPPDTVQDGPDGPGRAWSAGLAED
jgi:pimeloyl-ACP methyl ester carboxylesterase